MLVYLEEISVHRIKYPPKQQQGEKVLILDKEDLLEQNFIHHDHHHINKNIHIFLQQQISKHEKAHKKRTTYFQYGACCLTIK